MEQREEVLHAVKQLLNRLEGEEREVSLCLQGDVLEAYESLLRKEMLLVERKMKELSNH